MPFLPTGHDRAEAIQDEAVKAGEILCEIIDRRFFYGGRLADGVRLAVKFVGAIDLEGEIDRRELFVKTCGRVVGVCKRGNYVQCINGEVPGAVDGDRENVIDGCHRLDEDILHPYSTGNEDIVFCQCRSGGYATGLA